MKNITIVLILIIILTGCGKDKVFSPSKNVSKGNDWLVSTDDLLISDFGKDRIQSIDSPHFVDVLNAELTNNNIVYAFRFKDVIKVYPQRILERHEIVNDNIEDYYYVVTYCPLTGSAIAWNRTIDDTITEFGVSGHLYNENLIPYDRNSNSYWSQMKLSGIRGYYGGTSLTESLLVKSNWETIRTAFPNSRVLVDTSGHICNDSVCITNCLFKNQGVGSTETGEPLSGSYFGITNNSIIVGGNLALLFNYETFLDSGQIIKTRFINKDVIVYGNKVYELIIAFNIGNHEATHFYPVYNNLPVIFRDNLGNSFDLTGLIVDGPKKGTQLKSPISYWANSIAWKAFFNGSYEVYD